jgi:hypothetical protein
VCLTNPWLPSKQPPKPLANLRVQHARLPPRDGLVGGKQGGRGRLMHTQRADCASPMHALTCAAVYVCVVSLLTWPKTNLMFSACLGR